MNNNQKHPMKQIPKHPLCLQRLCALALILAVTLLAEGTTHAAKILFVVNSFFDPATTSNANDQEVLDRLVSQGHTVTLADHNAVSATDTVGQDLVLISSSVGSTAPGINPLSKNTLRAGKIPVVCYEPGLYDELGLQTATTFGNAANQTSLAISVARQSHPLAAGKSGTIEIVEPGATATISSGALPLTLGADAIVIATNSTAGSADLGRVSLWAHEKGSLLADNVAITTSRRVALFYNASTAVGAYSTNATDLFDAAITWALEPPPNLPIIVIWRSPANQNSFPDAALAVELEDGSTRVNTNSIVLTLNGTAVAPAISKTGTVTTVSFKPPSLFPAGSSNTARIVYINIDSPPQTFTNNWPFVVANYLTLASSLAYPTASADTSAPGFKARVVEANTFAGTLPNSEQRAEAQLAGTLMDPGTGQPYVNEANTAGADADGFFVDADVINWNQDAQGIGAEQGNFRAPSMPDEPIPGIPGLDGFNTDNIAAEILTFLELPAGAYTFGVNSDDGFGVAAGPDARDVLRTALGRFDGGRASADTTFSLVAEATGIYSFRLIWYEGLGGANLEWFSVDSAT
ncbi:MAG: hypothetical protein HY674_03965, partial [Chloroflexi bacterium]|nr:hypothetical protein [Chloroflexota bacterium]